MDPSIPYAWQPVGETIEVPVAKSKRLNVLGFLNTDNDRCHAWIGAVGDTGYRVAQASRFIKYWWLPFSAYLNFRALVEAVEDILVNVGSKYKIAFQLQIAPGFCDQTIRHNDKVRLFGRWNLGKRLEEIGF